MTTIEEDIEINKETIKEFQEFYLKHLGHNEDIASGYLEIIKNLREEVKSYERIIKFSARSNKKREQLGSGNESSSFEPW